MSARFTSNKECIDCYSDRRAKYFTAHPEIRLLQALRQRAKKLNLQFDLSTSDLKLSGACPICSTPFTPLIHDRLPGKNFLNMDPASPTVDRVNNSQGYTKSNIQVICASCNYIKSNLDAYQARARATRLLAIAAFIENHQKKVTCNDP